MSLRPALRLVGVSLLTALCFTTALTQEGADAQTQALVRRLQEGDRQARLTALEEMKGRGVAAKAAVPALAAALPALNELLNDQAPVVRLAAAGAVNKITSHGTKPQ
jgi:HEAT repeat protein